MSPIPTFSVETAAQLATDQFGVVGVAQALNSYRDQNFLLETAGGRRYVLKIAHSDQSPQHLAMENAMMLHLSNKLGSRFVPHVYLSLQGEKIADVTDAHGTPFQARLIDFLPGQLLADRQPNFTLLENLGRFLAQVDLALDDFDHPALQRKFRWDLQQALWIEPHAANFPAARQALLRWAINLYRQRVLPLQAVLPRSAIYNDANTHNLLTAGPEIVGVFDFGDAIYSHTINELAIALAYVMLDKDAPLREGSRLVGGYHQLRPLSEAELAALFPLAVMRLAVSVTVSHQEKLADPDNEYLTISQQPAWAMLAKLRDIGPQQAWHTLRAACQFSPLPNVTPKADLLARRARVMGPSLSISYDQPLKIVRGLGQYLYDETGRAYLDAVNNVPHVGHSHPRVVAAGQAQMALLNTNTRYLHDYLTEYAEKLVATLPEPLSVCFLVCTGSEANELALRLARTYTNRRAMIVLDSAYHGNTTATVELSPYKFNGPGGTGPQPYIHTVPMPNPYRGRFRRNDPQAGPNYALAVADAIEAAAAQGEPLAGFIAESVLGVGGQVVLPPNYLPNVYRRVREAGGVCIADEVQVGFGRVGSHFWGFELQGVVPDIVTMGKPIGNGHPLAAVVTTPAIAHAFNNGMEYFNTFGGNPVSCAIGGAVLDVIADQGLQHNALTVGQHLLARLRDLQARHALIGDVRGVGLFVGVELVRDHQTLAPADHEAAAIVNAMKAAGVLISVDGPLHNVLKIKPPLVFNRANADFLADTLDGVLTSGAFE